MRTYNFCLLTFLLATTIPTLSWADGPAKNGKTPLPKPPETPADIDLSFVTPPFGIIDKYLTPAGPACINEVRMPSNPCEKGDGEWKKPFQVQWTVDSRDEHYDMINLYVHGSLQKLRLALEQQGWLEARPFNAHNEVKYVEAVGLVLASRKPLLNLSEKLVKQQQAASLLIQTMPVSSEFMCGQPQITSFEKDNHTFGGRNHLRVFDTGKKDEKGRPVWAIAASLDTKIIVDKTRPSQLFMNHRIESNEDHERDKVLRTLLGSNSVLATEELYYPWSMSAPASGAYSEDGKVYNVILYDF